MPLTENPQPDQPAAPGRLPGALSPAIQKQREAVQDTREVVQNQRDAVQDTREFTQSMRESSNTRRSDQELPHSGMDSRKAGQKLQRHGQKTQKADQDLRNSRLGTQEDGQNLQRPILDVRESEQNLRESEQNLREAEQNLRENSLALVQGEEWFRLLVEGVTDYAIYMLDPEGRVVTWNAGAERSKGYKAEEILGQNYSIFFLPEDAEAGEPARELAEAEREGQYQTEAWRMRKDGAKFWAIVTLTAIRDGQGELRGFAKVTRDMSAQKAAEEVLRSHNAQLESYRIIVENIDSYAIFTLDVEGRINSWSPGARNVVGYTAEEVMGREYSIVFTPEEIRAGKPLQEMEEAERNGSCVTESWRVRRDGARCWASGSLTAVRNETGKLTGFIRMARDMTGHKQIEDAQARLAGGLEVRVRERTLQMEDAQARLAAELEDRVRERTLQLEANMEELRRRNAEAEASAINAARELQEKEVLFREIHHRVKNNLQVVQSLLKMEVRTLPPSEARAAIESMVLRVRSMAMVHERLCQMPGLASLSVAGYLRDIFDGAIASYSIQPGQIKFDLDAEDILLNLDRAIPFGLLANELLSNSLKHGFPAGRKGTIAVSIHRVAGAVRVVIQDNGIGLPMNFDAGSCKSMGLKLVESLAHQLGGALQFTSKQGCHVQGNFTRL
jgi:PAS domain S-box-containing protein